MRQAFQLYAPITRIVVATERTATLEVIARIETDEPVPGAEAYVNPNVMRLQTASFGTTPGAGEMPFQTLAALPRLYSAVTDQNGVAVLPNIPAFNQSVEIYHPRLQVPLQEPKSSRRRHLRHTLSPGETQKLLVSLEPKGADFTGDSN